MPPEIFINILNSYVYENLKYIGGKSGTFFRVPYRVAYCHKGPFLGYFCTCRYSEVTWLKLIKKNHSFPSNQCQVFWKLQCRFFFHEKITDQDKIYGHSEDSSHMHPRHKSPIEQLSRINCPGVEISSTRNVGDEVVSQVVTGARISRCLYSIYPDLEKQIPISRTQST